jgi:ribosomal protein S18 acetylase RimI-like enzyme
MKIRFMQREDLPAVVAIHIERFPASRSGALGRRFLTRLYQWFLVYNPELSLVAVDDDNRVLGFFVSSKGPYGQKVFRYTLPAIVLSLVANPARLLRKDIFANAAGYLSALVFRRRPEAEAAKGLEAGDEAKTVYYASFAVASAHAGAGGLLMFAMEVEARKDPERNFLSAWVEIENERVVKAYLAFGFKIVYRTSNEVRLVKTIR